MKNQRTKNSIKITTGILLITALVFIASCKKDEHITESIKSTDNYASVQDFHDKNEVGQQDFSIDAATGGSFTTPQGTIITIPPSAFKMPTSPYSIITGNVKISFKDIYKKSDMILSDRATRQIDGTPLKSGGEFNIKVTSNSNPVILIIGKTITIEQPVANTGGGDNSMTAFQGTVTTGNAFLWSPFPVMTGSTVVTSTVTTVYDSVYWASQNYLYQLRELVNSNFGKWGNTDCCGLFCSYSQTTLTLHGNDNTNVFGTDVFLAFKDVNSVVHVYRGLGDDFPDPYAPLGLQCTVVAIGVKDGKLYASFTPITITANLTVNFSLTETTTDAFKTQLDALN